MAKVKTIHPQRTGYIIVYNVKTLKHYQKYKLNKLFRPIGRLQNEVVKEHRLKKNRKAYNTYYITWVCQVFGKAMKVPKNHLNSSYLSRSRLGVGDGTRLYSVVHIKIVSVGTQTDVHSPKSFF